MVKNISDKVDNNSDKQERENRGFLYLWHRQKEMLVKLGVLFCVGIFLMVAYGKNTTVTPMLDTQSAMAKDNVPTKQENASPELEQILEQIEGVGDVSVFVTYAESETMEYAVNFKTTEKKADEQSNGELTRQTTEKQVDNSLVMGSDKSPVLVKKYMPKVEGVLVVAEGAGNAQVRNNLHHAIMGVMNVPAHKVIINKK